MFPLYKGKPVKWSLMNKEGLAKWTMEYEGSTKGICYRVEGHSTQREQHMQSAGSWQPAVCLGCSVGQGVCLPRECLRRWGLTSKKGAHYAESSVFFWGEDIGGQWPHRHWIDGIRFAISRGSGCSRLFSKSFRKGSKKRPSPPTWFMSCCPE